MWVRSEHSERQIVCQIRAAPRLLSEEREENVVSACQNVYERLESDREAFWEMILGDETRVYGCDAEIKKQSS